MKAILHKIEILRKVQFWAKKILRFCKNEPNHYVFSCAPATKKSWFTPKTTRKRAKFSVFLLILRGWCNSWWKTLIKSSNFIIWRIFVIWFGWVLLYNLAHFHSVIWRVFIRWFGFKISSGFQNYWKMAWKLLKTHTLSISYFH